MKKIDNIYMKRIGYFNIYVIKGKDGDILIDTGFICMKRAIKRWLNNFNIKLIILTHAHVDHIWNTSYIKELYNCEVAICKDDITNIDNKNINPMPYKKKYKTWTKIMNYGMNKFKSKEFKIDIELNDNDEINKFDLNLKIISLKGHTNGSIGIVYNNYLFCGDALVNRGKPSIAFQNQDNDEAYKSLLKILKLKPKLIFVGHDKPIKIEKLEKIKI